jgi:ribose 5-phosphate isomerase A
MEKASQDNLKRQAAEKAVDLIRSGMVVGLGHGSTAIHAVRKLASLLREGVLRDICAIPCSRQVQRDAEALGIPLTTLDEHPRIDLTIDGADEVDPQFNAIKGGGGALLREKIVAQASLREVIVVDESKLSDHLGARFDLPVEIIRFACRPVSERLEKLGYGPVLRQRGGEPFVSDEGNWIIDCHTGPLPDLRRFLDEVNGIAGVVEHGLFTGLVTDLIVAGAQGIVHRRPE